MPKYVHTFMIAFEVESDDEGAEDVTNEMLRKGIEGKIDKVDAFHFGGWVKACGAPCDTYEKPK